MFKHPYFSQRADRRASRQASFGAVRSAVREAASGSWDLKERLNGEGVGRPSTLPETIRKVIASVRGTLDSIGEFPIPPTIEYQSVRSIRAAAGGTERNPLIADGVIMLHARFITKTGVRDEFDVPVMIREGQVVQPSVIVHGGTLKVLAPSSIREMVASGTFTQQAPSRGQFSAPLSHDEAIQWNQVERSYKTRTRLNPGMFSVSASSTLLRAAVRGDHAFEGAQRTAQLGAQPSRAAMGFSASPGTRVGDRIVTQITWEPERVEGMGDANLQYAIRSYVLELGTKKEWRDWGTIADVQVDGLDREDGSARVSFKSSEISAPQLSGAAFEDLDRSASISRRCAAIGPSQDETHLEPAERDRSGQFHIGDEVKLTKGQLLRNRGGGTEVVPKGTVGKVVGDIFGDGLNLKVVFEDVSPQQMVIPASHIKRASVAVIAGVTAEKIITEIANLRQAGYSPIDAILTTRKRYGGLGEAALKQAKTDGLLDW